MSECRSLRLGIRMNVEPQGMRHLPTKPTCHRTDQQYANTNWKHLYDRARWKHPLTGLRAAVLRKYPICTECSRNPTPIADHKIDHRGNETLFVDFKNLTGKCDSCHSKKTGSQHGIGKREPSKPGLVDRRIVEYALK
jgi:5-methylcytosine-specific restriction endonuclease McrA